MEFGIIFLFGVLSFGYPASKILHPKILHPLVRVQNSHIQGNVPSQFNKVLKRDLLAYFQDLDKQVVTVEYELLRKNPTQVGVASPKYYLWVKTYGQKGLIDEGAVKVAAVEKIRFIVVNYLAIADLKKSPENINRIFPLPVSDKIRARLK